MTDKLHELKSRDTTSRKYSWANKMACEKGGLSGMPESSGMEDSSRL